MNRTASSTATIVSVVAAFLGSGGLKAGTPLAIASVPVSATEPEAKARMISSSPSGSRGSGAPGSGEGGAACSPRTTIRYTPIAIIEEGRTDEEIRRDGEDVPGFPQPPKVAEGDQHDRGNPDQEAFVRDLGDSRDDLLDRGRCGDGDRHDVIDEQRPGCHEGSERWQIGAGDRIGATARGVGVTDLAVARRDDGEEESDRSRDRQAQEQEACPCEDKNAQDLFGGIGGGADRVGTEDREGLLLGKALADVFMDGEGTTEQDRSHAGEGTAGRRPRHGSRLFGD